MHVFLTSSPTGPLDGARKVVGMDSMNHFDQHLFSVWKENSRCLIIAASPQSFDMNDEMTHFFYHACLDSGLSVATFDCLDYRNPYIDLDYDVIFLGGGHVPTENAFFQDIHLKERLQDFDGILIGISAGTMNCASIVYAQPEEPGEAINPNYHRFIEGLGITDTQILPHYQMVKEYMLDGYRLYEDITYNDSYGHQFLVLVDGSYLYIHDGQEIVYGEAYIIKDGILTPICRENEHVWYNSSRV